MMIKLIKATEQDLFEIHQMQIKAFASLLKKYRDDQTNPGNEPITRVQERFEQPETTYYLIKDEQSVGALRVHQNITDNICRVSPIFILPEYQNHGYAQQAMNQLEIIYKDCLIWQLSTILEEEKLCYFYEKLGYQKTGSKTLKEDMTLVFFEKKIINKDL